MASAPSPSEPPVIDDPASSGPDPAIGTVLAPRYWVSAGVVVLGIALLALQPLWGGVLWVTVAVALFGLVLALQTALLRLQFAPAELLVWRGSTCIRRFPYAEWIAWRLYWPPVPVIFYFREQRSIHLLPMLFEAEALAEQLRRHLPHLSPETSAGDA
ncbi:DUF3119 family protein [Synechococcus sp. CCY9201]|uniref:DUF3119 family protein n=1 Tax=Synechococcus sp. CCY9201 TaxID=174697 RepID=UPI002B200798|nr:DUF3119 family protein [Synechococcus sp. CCY9201]MEA5473575.1 DUF3119 family protein [Synechococcus sp. CCY9201]CAK6697625.1 hypothetical protein IFHNHDMJ_02266 [Synechococcus sp. CBW1107]